MELNNQAAVAKATPPIPSVTSAVSLASPPPPRPSATHDLVLISSEMAAQFLTKLHPRQRRQRPKHYHMIRGDMSKGKWVYTGEPIRFDKNGFLIDGQHRLKAIVESGVSCWCLVIRNLDPEAIDHIDVDQQLRSQQVIQMMRGGGRLVPNAAVNAATTLEAHDFLTREASMSSMRDRLDDSDSLDEAVLGGALLLEQRLRTGKIYSRGALAGAIRVLKEAPQCFDFLAAAFSNDATSAAYGPMAGLLFNRLHTLEAGKSTQQTLLHQVYAVVRASRAYVKRESVPHLRSPKQLDLDTLHVTR